MTFCPADPVLGLILTPLYQVMVSSGPLRSVTHIVQQDEPCVGKVVGEAMGLGQGKDPISGAPENQGRAGYPR